LLFAYVALLVLTPAALAASGSISGAVTEATGAKNPIAGVGVFVVNAASREIAGSASTAANGEYKTTGLAPGSYKVAFEPTSGIFAPQFYNDASSFSTATEVTIVTEGEEKPGINAALREGGKISGKVKGSHGEPLQGIKVYALNEEALGFAEARTNANGEYTLTGLAKGSYEVEFVPEAETNLRNLVPQLYEGANSPITAKLVPVKEEETKENVNAVLQEGGEISGTVTDAATQTPLGEVCVSANNSLGFEFFGGFAETTANGKYTIHGLEKGSYNLVFEHPCPGRPGTQFVTQFVNGVSVTTGSATAINVALIRKAPVNTARPTLSGTPAVGQQLSCSKGSWTGALPLVFTYAWLRDGTVITGASANTYVVEPADRGHALACQVTATNSVSRASATSNTLKVPAPPPTPPLPPPPPPQPPVPTIESLTQSNSVWSEGGKLATFSRKKKARVGTTISFVLNEPASVSFAFTQQLGGRKVKGRCVTQTKKNRHKPSCRRTVTQGTLSFASHTGLNKVVFQGRISPSKRLRLGTYTLGITATNSVGERSSPRSLNFTIVK
jgi:hypothetical protein